MGLRIPQNQIVANKYTIGKEYMYKDTYREYQGYYYELNNKLFTGKEFNSNAPELILTPKNNNVPSGFNSLLTKASTYVYGRISKTKINQIKILSLPLSTNNNLLDKAGEFFLKFFYQKINQSPIIIKEIDEDTYKALQNNPLYQTTFIGTYNNKTQTPEIAETQMPGINAFLNL